MSRLMHVGMELTGEVIYYDEDPDWSDRYWIDGERPMDIDGLCEDEMALINLNAILNICRIASEEARWRE